MGENSIPKITVIGGGSGRFTLLEGLKEFPVEISAIVSMADSGGSSGRLKSELGVLPPGDVRQCLVALSTSPKVMLDLFNYRFKDGSLSGHSFGNLFLTALEKTTGSFEKGIGEAEKILAIKGRVIPVTLDRSELYAELEDGTVIEGETSIDIPERKRPKIKRVFLNPEARATGAALACINEADLVVIGPGDLYTSILPNFLVRGITGALKKSAAKKVLVLPLATKHGETDGMGAGDIISETEKYAGCGMDCVISNNKKFSAELEERYFRTNAKQLPVNVPDVGGKRISRNLLLESGGLARHHPEKTARAVLSCLGG